MKAEKNLKTCVAKSKIFPKETDYVLIDECDEVYFSSLKWFESTFKTTTVLGFTATVPDLQEPTEVHILEQFFKVNIFDSELKLQMKEGIPELHLDNPVKTTEEKLLVEIDSRKNPVIVFCHKALHQTLMKYMKPPLDSVFINNCKDKGPKLTRDQLENLDNQ